MKNTKIGNINLPVSYSVDSFDNERFMKLRIKVMHTGLNLNNSNFGLEAIEKAQPTIANIPLLAFIKKTDGEENSDFAGHEYEIKITENDVKFVYLGRPIGIVPETNNYSVETDEDGKTFVMVDAYVWKDYANSALDILNRDEVKKVSMEILVDDYEWHDSYVDITAYKYTGIALLGEDVKEAMLGAKAEVVQFSADSISAMMQELKMALATFSADSEITANAEELIDNETSFSEENSSEENVKDITENITGMSAEETAHIELNLESLHNADQTATALTIESTEEVVDYTAIIEELHNQIANLTAENAELKEFKANTEKVQMNAAIEDLFNQFDDLEEEEKAPLRESNFSLEELEIRLFALRGKKVKSSATPKLGLDSLLFDSSRNKPEPEYADLVRKYRQN